MKMGKGLLASGGRATPFCPSTRGYGPGSRCAKPTDACYRHALPARHAWSPPFGKS